MEAASGGYVDVGRVLLDKGADVNATPVPSSRDTALTIAADKGHCRFVELLLSRYFFFCYKNFEFKIAIECILVYELNTPMNRLMQLMTFSRSYAMLWIWKEKKKVHNNFFRNAAVEVKNKKGNSPLWLAANGGHLYVVEILYSAGADIDSQDNRKVFW